MIRADRPGGVMVVLHDYWRSSASYRVRIALGLAGVSWDRVAVDLVAGDQRSAAHRAVNPQGLVPVLEIDGLVLTQSLAIIEYLDETRDLGLLAADAQGRARVRALAHAIAMEVAPVCNLSVRAYAAEISGGAVSADDWQRRFIAQGLAAFEVLLHHPATGAFCHGDRPTLPDLCLVPQVYNARRVGLDVAAYPRIAAVVHRLESIPAFSAAHPDNHKP
jgi:maleylacetoacetate isomerase